MTEEITEPNKDIAPAEGSDTIAAGQEESELSPPDGQEPNKDAVAAAKKPEKKEWYIDTITGLRAGKREADARVVAAEAATAAALEALAAVKNGAVIPETKTESLPEDEIQRRAIEMAKGIAAQQSFNNTCNDVYNSGKTQFSDFDAALANLSAVGAVGPNVDTTFLQAVVDLPNSEKLLHHLGNNPEEASRITKLTPIKMAIELAKIESSLSNPAPKKLSEVPPPTPLVNGKGKSDADLNDPNLDTAKWMELRRAEKAKRVAN